MQFSQICGHGNGPIFNAVSWSEFFQKGSQGPIHCHPSPPLRIPGSFEHISHPVLSSTALQPGPVNPCKAQLILITAILMFNINCPFCTVNPSLFEFFLWATPCSVLLLALLQVFADNRCVPPLCRPKALAFSIGSYFPNLSFYFFPPLSLSFFKLP